MPHHKGMLGHDMSSKWSVTIVVLQDRDGDEPEQVAARHRVAYADGYARGGDLGVDHYAGRALDHDRQRFVPEGGGVGAGRGRPVGRHGLTACETNDDHAGL